MGHAVISRVRIDDMMWQTGNPDMAGKEMQKFLKYVNWCRGADIYVVPNVLCQDIQRFPEAVEMLDDFDQVDLHGWDHGPYGDRSYGEICVHLEQAMEWFDKNTNHTPIRWVTPHGANSFAIKMAARKFDLVVETCDPPVIDQKEADGLLKRTRRVSDLDGKVIMAHWWERGLALYRITQILKAGSVDQAIIDTKSTLDKKSYGICWDGWS